MVDLRWSGGIEGNISYNSYLEELREKEGHNDGEGRPW